MPTLYHIVAKKFTGQGAASRILYPLNVLKTKHPDLHQAYAQKYANRKHVQELYIPQLKCYWGDVIHLSAVRPETIIDTLKSLGRGKDVSYYEVNSALLNQERLIVYTNIPRGNMRTVTAKDFVAWQPKDIEQWQKIPQETIDYYQKKISAGAIPLLFLFIPHILYKGSIDVSHLPLKSTTGNQK